MPRSYRVVVADSEGGVLETAKDEGFTILNPIRQFTKLDTLDDGTLGEEIGRLFVKDAGYVAIAYKDD